MYMLKNWFNNVRIRNFIKSLFFFDFFIKKFTQRSLISLNKFTVFFLEKFIVEYMPKKIYNLITRITNPSLFTKTIFLPVVLIPINFLFILLAVLII